jgi:hypothetical protein
MWMSIHGYGSILWSVNDDGVLCILFSVTIGLQFQLVRQTIWSPLQDWRPDSLSWLVGLPSSLLSYSPKGQNAKRSCLSSCAPPPYRLGRRKHCRVASFPEVISGHARTYCEGTHSMVSIRWYPQLVEPILN